MMRLFALLICLSVSCYPAQQGGYTLQGKWTAIEATSNGEPPPPGMMKNLTLNFVGQTVSIMGAPPSRFTLDNHFTPAHIDLLNSRHQVGIYELKGDTLKICFGMDGDRPRTFHTEKYTDHTYMSLRRVKE